MPNQTTPVAATRQFANFAAALKSAGCSNT